ncbi:MAG: hypothetical protein K2P94_18615, partial [Rhodospirillaceae bacterium]|nr:hypothetical protein [Rhodospirillaceae bacterium]
RCGHSRDSPEDAAKLLPRREGAKLFKAMTLVCRTPPRLQCIVIVLTGGAAKSFARSRGPNSGAAKQETLAH